MVAIMPGAILLRYYKKMHEFLLIIFFWALNYADVNWVPYGIDASYQCLCMDNNLDAGKLQPKRLYQLYLESKDEEYEKAFYQPYFIPSKESRRQKEILEGREKYEKKALDFMRSQKQTLPGECRVKDFNEGLVEYQNKMFRVKKFFYYD
jgi:hypothetical protein